jgi:hypothetical protein
MDYSKKKLFHHFDLSNREHAPLLVVASTALNRAILGTGRLCARRLARTANHTAAVYSWLFLAADAVLAGLNTLSFQLKLFLSKGSRFS